MFCPKCGKEIEDGSKECVACGEKFEVNEPAIQTQEIPQIQEVSNVDKKCKKAKTSLIVAIVGLIIAGIICGTYALITGIQALKEIKEDKELSGRGVAIAGVVLGLLDVVLSIYSITVLF